MAALTPVVLSNLDSECSQLTTLWKEGHLSHEDFVAQLNSHIHPNSASRFRFRIDSKQAAATALFDVAFKKEPDNVIAAAEKDTGRSFYPLWKRVILIGLPQLIGNIFDNILVKIAVVVLTVYLFWITGFAAYEASQYFVGAKVVPFIINNTPVAVIRIFNTAYEYISMLFENWIATLFYTWAAREVILLGPEIPYITPAARAINMCTLFHILTNSPQTITWFLISTCINTVKAAVNACNDISQFFLHLAENAESERLSLSKAEAQNLWLKEIAPRQLNI